jgi:hypothetical protein
MKEWIKDYFKDRGTHLIANAPLYAIEEMFKRRI